MYTVISAVHVLQFLCYQQETLSTDKIFSYQSFSNILNWFSLQHFKQKLVSQNLNLVKYLVNWKYIYNFAHVAV